MLQQEILQGPPAQDDWIDRVGLGRREVDIPWELLRNRPLTLREKQVLREFYAADFHHRMNYTSASLLHRTIADFRFQVARAVFGDLGRVVDAGCSGGLEVREFRRRGVDCWGFDLCPDLHDIAFPEVRPFLRMGGLDAIPFSPADGFRTLVSYDVFEHVPIDALCELPGELLRLGIRQVACIVSADTIGVGHITIQNTEFYTALFARAGFRLRTELTDRLREVPVPWAMHPEKEEIVWALYEGTGQPRNGWNRVPGHLFFIRE